MRTSRKGLIALSAAAAVSLATGAPAEAGTETYKYSTGEHQITIPLGVSSLNVVAVGGTGGNGDGAISGVPQTTGGDGAIVQANLPVVGGQTYYLEVGGNGGNGSDASGGCETGAAFCTAGGGGGASDIRTLPNTDPLGFQHDTRLLVAAGGGGGGSNVLDGSGLGRPPTPGASAGGAAGSAGTDGDAGYPAGQAGYPDGDNAGGCAADSASVGGCGGNGTLGFGGVGGGTKGQGGTGGFNGGGTGGQDVVPGGGGGGGYFGGGGGSIAFIGASSGGGGGGGSNLVPAGGTVSLDTTASPSITISFTENTPPNVTLNTPPAVSNNNTPTLTGSAATALGDNSQVAVFIYRGSTPSSSGLVQADTATVNPATGAYSVNVSTLPDGTYTAEAIQQDAAGDTGLSPQRTFTIDTTPPVLTLTGAARTNNQPPTLSGIAGLAAGDSATVTVKLYRGSTTTGTPEETYVATRNAATGAYSVQALGPLGVLTVGTYTAVATQSDWAGNVGSSAPLTFNEYETVTTSLTVVPTTAIIHGLTPVTMTAATDNISAAGTVQFWDIVGSYSSFTFVPLGGRVPVVFGIAAKVSTLAQGTFAVVAQFFPTNTTLYQGSYSPNVNLTVL